MSYSGRRSKEITACFSKTVNLIGRFRYNVPPSPNSYFDFKFSLVEFIV